MYETNVRTTTKKEGTMKQATTTKYVKTNPPDH